jgi:hypothetical protein
MMKNLKTFSLLIQESKIITANEKITNYNDLVDFFSELGVYVFDEQIEMKKFISDFGANKNSEEWAEYLDDYYRNPSEYSIDTESDYYGLICKFYEDSVEPHARFILSGPMRMMTFDRFDYDRISETPEYKLYSRMSKE